MPRDVRRWLTAGVLLLASGFVVARLHGQVAPANQKPPAFEVASIKPNTTGGPASTIGFEPGGRFRAVNEPLVRLIQEAYATSSTPRPDVLNGPGWIDSENFNVDTITKGNPPREQGQAMLRALLADRFALAIHRDTREQPIYNLVKSSKDGTLGDKLRVSTIDCAALPTPGPGQYSPCMMVFGLASLSGKGMTLSQVATSGLARIVRRPVVDRTGLTGVYDWSVEWMPDQAAQGTDLGRPSTIFSAVQEQLGLRLEAAKGLVDVLVIDHVEKPTPD